MIKKGHGRPIVIWSAETVSQYDRRVLHLK